MYNIQASASQSFDLIVFIVIVLKSSSQKHRNKKTILAKT